MPFPKTPVTRLFRNSNFKMRDKQELRDFEQELRRGSDMDELYEIQQYQRSANNIAEKLIAKQEAIMKLAPIAIEMIDELLKLHQEIEELKAKKFIMEMSACISISTRRQADTCHRNAEYSSKYMLTSSSSFHVTHEGKISRKKKKSEIAQWKQILEVSEEDAVVLDESVDSVED